MEPAVHGGLRLLSGDGHGRSRARPAARWLVSAFVVLAIAVVLGAIIWAPSSQRRALRALPDQERLALLSRTVDDLRQYCGEGRPDALRDHCRDLASFAAQFDECSGACETLVHHELAPAPTR